MKNSARALHCVQRTNALATTGRSHRQAKRNNIYDNVTKTPPTSTAIVQIQPNLRITPPMQAEILRLYLCEIARRTHRARQTVTKVVRAPDIETVIRQQRERLLAESDAWAESINFAVTHELDGRLAYRLAKDFGAIPSPEKNVQPQKQNDWERRAPETLAKARVLGQIALERGSSRPPDAVELEAQVQETKVQSERKCRLFAKRD